MWPCHSVYRETARVERTISLLDFLTAPNTISNIGYIHQLCTFSAAQLSTCQCMHIHAYRAEYMKFLTDSGNELVSSRRWGTDSVNGGFVHARWASVN